MTVGAEDVDRARVPLRTPMRDLAVLPVFFALAGKRTVLAGATERAVWKAGPVKLSRPGIVG